MRDRAYIRVMHGVPVIFLGFTDAEHIVVNFKGTERIVTRLLWRSLPIAARWPY